MLAGSEKLSKRTLDPDAGWTARGHEQGGGAISGRCDSLTWGLVNIKFLARLTADRIVVQGTPQVAAECLQFVTGQRLK